MSAHAFHEIYLHLNWHTKLDQRILTAPIELEVHRFISERCRAFQGVFLHGINGTETHVHLALNIEPQVTISDLLRDLKGGSSHDTNKRFGRKLLYWQTGYGVVSFGKSDLDWVLRYIANQKAHHSCGRVFDRLERINSHGV